MKVGITSGMNRTLDVPDGASFLCADGNADQNAMPCGVTIMTVNRNATNPEGRRCTRKESGREETKTQTRVHKYCKDRCVVL